MASVTAVNCLSSADSNFTLSLRYIHISHCALNSDFFDKSL